MNENIQNVKMITLQRSSSISILKQPQQLEVLQVGDRITASLCGELFQGFVISPMADPLDLEQVRGAEFLIAGDAIWRVNWRNSHLLACSPREFVWLDGGAA